MFGKAHNRERFIAEKLRSTEARDSETSVRQLELNLREGRWGALINTCKQLLSVRMVFAYWSPDQPAPGPQASQEDRDSYEQVCAMTTAVRDNSWWQYLCVILRIARVIDHLEHWFEACPCHYKKPDDSVSLAGNRIFHTRYCSFAHQREQLLRSCVGLEPADCNKILQDFASGQAKIEQFFVVKFSFWTALPHKLCALGHHVEAVARATLSQARDFFREHEDSSQHHALTERFFRGALTNQLDDFLEGRISRANGPELLREASACCFISCVERGVEARHALLKAKTELMKRISPATFSLALRSHEFHRRCVSTLPMLAEWEAHVLRLKKHPRRGLPNALLQLGFAHHPEVLRSQEVSGKVRLRDAANVIYHCDLETQYNRQTAAASQLHGPDFRDNPATAQKLRRLVASQPTDDEKRSAMLRVLMREHFHDRCVEGQFYSIAGKMPPARVLQDAFVPKPKSMPAPANNAISEPGLQGSQMFLRPDEDPAQDFFACAEHGEVGEGSALVPAIQSDDAFFIQAGGSQSDVCCAAACVVGLFK